MQESFQETWNQLQNSVSVQQNISALTLAVYLLLGGFLALYVRLLYRRCSVSPSDSDSITRVFPLLTLVTIGVISVVKSSLALSLGLVGALSIVRFARPSRNPRSWFTCSCVSVSGWLWGPDSHCWPSSWWWSPRCLSWACMQRVEANVSRDYC